MSIENEYHGALERMVLAKARWIAANPTIEAKMQFNFPPDICFAIGIGDAVRAKLVTGNKAAAELIIALTKAAMNDGAGSEPTLLMIRAVMEVG